MLLHLQKLHAIAATRGDGLRPELLKAWAAQRPYLAFVSSGPGLPAPPGEDAVPDRVARALVRGGGSSRQS